MKLLLVLILCLAFSGCGDSYNEYECYKSVRTEFGYKADIKQFPGTKFRWAVKDEQGNIWFVETLSEINSNITTKELLFKAEKNVN